LWWDALFGFGVSRVAQWVRIVKGCFILGDDTDENPIVFAACERRMNDPVGNQPEANHAPHWVAISEKSDCEESHPNEQYSKII
jgi:hypothetical protein